MNSNNFKSILADNLAEEIWFGADERELAGKKVLRPYWTNQPERERTQKKARTALRKALLGKYSLLCVVFMVFLNETEV